MTTETKAKKAPAMKIKATDVTPNTVTPFDNWAFGEAYDAQIGRYIGEHQCKPNADGEVHVMYKYQLTKTNLVVGIYDRKMAQVLAGTSYVTENDDNTTTINSVPDTLKLAQVADKNATIALA